MKRALVIGITTCVLAWGATFTWNGPIGQWDDCDNWVYFTPVPSCEYPDDLSDDALIDSTEDNEITIGQSITIDDMSISKNVDFSSSDTVEGCDETGMPVLATDSVFITARASIVTLQIVPGGMDGKSIMRITAEGSPLHTCSQ